MKRHWNDQMAVAVNRDRCGICGCCVPICPPDAIALHDSYLEVDQDACTGCMKCLLVCPTHALVTIPLQAIATKNGERHETAPGV